MSSMARKKASILEEQKPCDQMSQEEKETMEIVERFAQKLSFKFKKIGDTFRFFDRNFDNSISYKEFRVVCEELDLRFNQQEL